MAKKGLHVVRRRAVWVMEVRARDRLLAGCEGIGWSCGEARSSIFAQNALKVQIREEGDTACSLHDTAFDSIDQMRFCRHHDVHCCCLPLVVHVDGFQVVEFTGLKVPYDLDCALWNGRHLDLYQCATVRVTVLLGMEDTSTSTTLRSYSLDEQTASESKPCWSQGRNSSDWSCLGQAKRTYRG